MPQMVHRDLVENPTRLAASQRAMASDQRDALAKLKSDPSSDPASLQAMSEKLEKLESAATAAENAANSRGQQFSTMRNDVFGTDKAVAAAISRLRARNVGDGAIAEFEKHAATVSTPDQVAALEHEVRR